MRADIVPVLTLAATVRSGVEYQLTSPTAGVFHSADAPFVAGPGASRTDVTVTFGKVERWLVSDGDRVTPGLPLAVVRYAGFALVSEVVGADHLRFTEQPTGARAQIDGAGGPFDCAPLDLRPTAWGDDDPAFVACAIPEAAPALEGLTATAVYAFPAAEDVLTVPLEAVAGTVDSGSVLKMDSAGAAEPVDVELGVTDGVLIEIRSGLAEGDAVRVPGPSLLEAG